MAVGSGEVEAGVLRAGSRRAEVRRSARRHTRVASRPTISDGVHGPSFAPIFVKSYMMDKKATEGRRRARSALPYLGSQHPKANQAYPNLPKAFPSYPSIKIFIFCRWGLATESQRSQRGFLLPSLNGKKTICRLFYANRRKALQGYASLFKAPSPPGCF